MSPRRSKAATAPADAPPGNGGTLLPTLEAPADPTAAAPGAQPDPPADPFPLDQDLPDDLLPAEPAAAAPENVPLTLPAHSGSIGAPLQELERGLGYTFKTITLLQRAMVHRSYLHDVPDFALGSNERLEFLGDAVLGFLVARWLYLRHPDKQEGELTALRGALVRLTRLSVWASMLDLGAYLYMSRGEEIQGGRARASIIGRAFEALLGAIYLDGGLRAVERVLKRFLAATSESDIAAALSGDYKSLLQRQVQSRFKTPPTYHLADTSGPAHQRIFRVGVWAGGVLLGEGEGRNKQQAEQAAAQAGVARLAQWEAEAATPSPGDPPPGWAPNPEVF